MSRAKPIGLLGGAFDPVHIGHLEMALGCLDLLDLREVRFIPAARPPHKPAPVAAGRHRLAMLELAVRAHPRLAVNDLELRRAGNSYTIDTLISLRRENALRPLCFIMGADAFETLPTWRRWRELPQYAHLILIDRKRPRARPADRRLQACRETRACSSAAALHTRPGGYIYKTELRVPDVSSSQLRALIGERGSAAAFCPPAVCRYIEENRLYR